eukprot:326432_1
MHGNIQKDEPIRHLAIQNQYDFDCVLQYFEDNPSIINGLHHVLMNHPNENIFQNKIYKYLKCNCESFKPNQTNNYTHDNQPTDPSLPLYNHILDNIYYIGNRINYKDNNILKMAKYSAHHKRFGEALTANRSEMTVNDKNTHDIVIKTEQSTKSLEYKHIRQYVQDALAQLLLREICVIPSSNDTDNIEYSLILEYKTANDLLNECTLCKVSDPMCVYINCESVKRMKIVLLAYQKYMGCVTLWRKVGLQDILVYNDIYTLTQINDDFIHIKDHIDASEKYDVRKKFQNEINCDNSTCWSTHSRFRREKYTYPKSMNLEDIVFQETCDKIHKYMIHPHQAGSDDRSNPSGNSNNENK